MSQWDFGMPPAEDHDSPDATDPFPPPAYQPGGNYEQYRQYDRYDEYGEEIVSPITYERDPYYPGPDPSAGPDPYAAGPDPYAAGPDPYARPAPGHASRASFEPVQPWQPTRPTQPEQPTQPVPVWPDESWPPRVGRGGGRRRWLVPSLVGAAAAAVGLALFLTNGGGGTPRATRSAPPLQPVQPAASSPPARPAGAAALTMTQAQQALAGYTTANNQANAQRSGTMLATIETGSSYAIDTGLYRQQQAQHAAPYPAFAPVRALYYIPRQAAAAYPHWFVAKVFNAYMSNPKKVTGTEYVVFTQAAPGAPWKNAIEPYVLSGASVPQITVGADGLATPVPAGTASLAVSPARIGQLTAASLDGTGTLGDPGNLADRLDAKFWQSKVPAASVTDQHATAGGQVFGLATAGGGALLFYTDTAELTLTPPQGETLHLSIPGFYSGGQALSRAGVGYLEQFATYVPPRGGTGLRVVADYSGITAAH